MWDTIKTAIGNNATRSRLGRVTVQANALLTWRFNEPAEPETLLLSGGVLDLLRVGQRKAPL